MNEWTDRTEDELLGAYLDRELPRDVTEALTERLAREPELVRRLGRLRDADVAARETYAAIDRLPMPQRVLDLLDSDAAGSAAGKPASNVVSLRPGGLRRYFQMPVALAAGLALVAGFFIAGQMQRMSTTDAAGFVARNIAPGDEIHSLLETGTGSASVVFTNGTVAELRLTFADLGGDFCREIHLRTAESSAQALACRRNYQWQLETISFGAPSAGAYQTASAPTHGSITAAIDALIGDNEPLEADEEARLVENGWQ
jgi:anti-sigma factor RsiW